MHKKYFYLLLLAITLLGLALRLLHYDSIPPFAETMDEFHYAWAGLTWITEGVPRSWSWLASYSNPQIVQQWGHQFALVSPMLEKPPLYMWLTGSWMYLTGVRNIFDVRLNVLRLVPIALSVFTIFGVGLLAKKIFSEKIGLLAALLYTIVPTIILGNRFSLTENLLTPLAIWTLIAINAAKEKTTTAYHEAFLVGIGTGLAILAKQTGLALFFAVFILYAVQKKWREISIVTGISVLAALVFPFIGLLYNWELFVRLTQELNHIHSLSTLPELVMTIFRFPGISCKECVFIDGTIFLGYLAFFTAPLWIQTYFGKEKHQQHNKLLLLGFPFLYLALLSFLHSGAQTFYGWYLYPLFPFLMILVAKIFIQLYENFSSSQLLMVILTAGILTIRLLLSLFPAKFVPLWQFYFGLLLLIVGLTSIFPNTRYRRQTLVILFIIFVCIQIYADLNLSLMYKTLAQPLG